MAFKVAFLGETGTGKTSLISRLIHDTFSEEKTPTIGGSGHPFRFTLQGQSIDLVLWDTAGQEFYRGLTPMYYRESAAAVIVFDVARRRSFDQVLGWVNELQANVGGDIIIVVCGNKIDLTDTRVVGETDGGAIADAAAAAYCEASAKTGLGTEALLLKVVRLIIHARPRILAAREAAKGPIPIERTDREGGCC